MLTVNPSRAVSGLLISSKLSKKDAKTLDKLQEDAAKITQALRKLVEQLRKVPGAGEDLQLESDDDLEAMAEAELRKCVKNCERVSAVRNNHTLHVLTSRVYLEPSLELQRLPMPITKRKLLLPSLLLPTPS